MSELRVCAVKLIHTGHLAVALLVMFLGLTGCGGTGDKPDLGQVTGTVTLDGQPLSGVAVVFQPDNGRPARGMTDAEGKYDLIYIRNERGTKVGHNRVEIAPSEEGEDEGEEAEDPDSVEPAKPVKSGKPKVPAKYNLKTELEADVKPGDNTFDFNLES
ncbi:carboxypeptidase regulatory-like domain-containing protein [Bremerella cremea]|uniref:Carboxypeptidase regulatory-like domain-containing protein n=1 Tax=Blastopirellula marina TaxID=124 RepID=A0A2S8FZT5_9BACT|nr:hypothetical protein C5Y83_07100 [Blastopirellula marina]RCS50092.1 carboxypeptidase regulatory-like domain-containing protein [Bremerella cremea]